MAERLKENKEYKIPAEGSLGLLALGYRGLLEWRKVRDARDPEKSPVKNSGNQ